MIPELIISGEDAKGEFLMSVPRKMLLCTDESPNDFGKNH